jgi:hypothetical protein
VVAQAICSSASARAAIRAGYRAWLDSLRLGSLWLGSLELGSFQLVILASQEPSSAGLVKKLEVARYAREPAR